MTMFLVHHPMRVFIDFASREPPRGLDENRHDDSYLVGIHLRGRALSYRNLHRTSRSVAFVRLAGIGPSTAVGSTASGIATVIMPPASTGA
jgi:hypothetical protein